MLKTITTTLLILCSCAIPETIREPNWNLEARYAGECELELDTDGDGRRNAYSVSHYDENENLKRVVLDYDGDGDADSRYEFTYNSENLRLTYLNVNLASTGDETLTTYSYNPGSLLEFRRQDDGNDGSIERTRQYFYDADLKRVRRQEDDDGDGDVDSSTDYFYDEFGFSIRTEEDVDGDGVADTATVFTNDSNGHFLSAEGFNISDGEIIFRSTSSYNEEGQRLSSGFEFPGGDGADPFSSLRRNTYDSHGNILVTEATYTHGENVTFSRSIYHYDCWF